MISLLYPDIVAEALQYPGGLNAFNHDGKKLLIVKLPTNYLLTAKVMGGFKVYVVPIMVEGIATIGLMSAFFDDEDSPLTLWTPLMRDKPMERLIASMLQNEIHVHLFDELNRELLGFVTTLHVPLLAKVRLEHATLHTLNHQQINLMGEHARTWFSTRTPQDDADAISVNFTSSLMPDDVFITDMSEHRNEYIGGKGFVSTSLIREEPGLFQEQDIIGHLQKIVNSEQIFHAPKRVYDNEEIADIIVITERICLIIQAKSSPNTQQQLSNTLERKKRKALKHLKEGIKQVSGALGYLDRVNPLKMQVAGEVIEFDLSNREILSLVIVGEMFDDSYGTYSDALLTHYETEGLPCLALDYSDFCRWTTYCDELEGFENAYKQVFHFALKHGQIPRLRFGRDDLFDAGGNFKFANDSLS